MGLLCGMPINMTNLCKCSQDLVPGTIHLHCTSSVTHANVALGPQSCSAAWCVDLWTTERM